MTNPQPITQNIQSFERRRCRLVQDFSIELEDGDTIFIAKDFEYDKSSIPRIAQLFVSDTEDANMAAPSLVHDFLYENAIGTKSEADLIFKQLLKRYTSLSNWKLNAMYWSVKLFGKGAW